MIRGDSIGALTRAAGVALLFSCEIAACGDSGSDEAAGDAAVDRKGSGGSSGFAADAAAGSGGTAGSGGSSGSGGSTTDSAGGSGATDASNQQDSQSASDGANTDSTIFDARACASDGGCGLLECCYQDHCIQNGQPCGAGNVCFANPIGNSCQPCGHAGQPCCTGNVCVDMSRCVLTPQGARCVS